MNTSAFTWPEGKRAAVCLTYDDAVPCHYEHVGPLLEKHGLRGTFYLTLSGVSARGDFEQWRQLAAAGHELGNHTLFHPCRDEARKEQWIRYNLIDYSLQRWREEVTVGNAMLQLIDGRGERTYGNTCHDNLVGPADAPVCIDEAIEELFVGGRGTGPYRICDPATTALGNLGAMGGDRKTSPEELMAMVEQAVEAGGCLILCFHGVGEGTHPHFIDADVHRRFVEAVGARKEIWGAPVVDVARHIRASRE